MSEIEKFNKINYSKTAKILCVLFVLSVASIVMVYSKFVQGVEDFWQEKDASVLADGLIYDVIDLDTLEPEQEETVSMIDSLASEYMEKQGEVSVFDEIFTCYTE